MNYPRRYLTPGASNMNKRKYEFDAVKPLAPPSKITQPGFLKPGFGLPPTSPKPISEPASNNLLLAGYFAHEFLSKGTLFGEPWDPARAESVPVSAGPDLNRGKLKEEPSAKAEPKQQRYKEMAALMKTDGAHIAGVVNPTQLARFIQM